MHAAPVVLVALCCLVAAASVATAAPAATSPGPGNATPAGATATDLEGDPLDARSCPARAATPNREAAVDEPRLVELYPNPTTHGNAGEYLVLAVPSGTALGNLTVTDGYATASLPNETAAGRVAASPDPEIAAAVTDHPVVELDGNLRLAADGDALEIRAGNRTVDAASYDRAPEAEVWYRDDSPGKNARGEWWPREASCRPATAYDPGEATAFVLPDSPEVPLETLRDADDRLLLAGYTFTSEAVTAELAAAADRGVDVRVLVEAGPAGGTPAASDPLLAGLEARGVDVRALGGEGSRYRYHHPKYAVVDDAVVVTSENWKPAGVGGASSRGWGVRVEDGALADDLAAVFAADAGGPDVEPWSVHRERATFVDEGSRSGEYPTEHGPATVSVDAVELVVAPDNAEARLLDLVAGAEESLLIEQPSVAPDASLLAAAVAAAERGVEVRILLDSSWYVADENEALAASLEAAAADEDLPLDVALVEPGDRFEKIHAKGVVIDDEVAVVGSANWNDGAVETNREVLLVLRGAEAASFYAAVFEADWNGRTWTLPVELALVVLAALALAALVGREKAGVAVSRRAGSRSRGPRRCRRRPSSRRGRR
ncbi:phospholipase D-like domain-containing protein [Salinilacihabitans rarus]|uniref:phospholipase D-like domain-containing protein n=1 Tax=Salinilacihabitans rarus TaxID=2961596 RepID=UPI0020C83774|nr:phospholipase D-like domain-containing protein [Salinilacihabitans rarus]